MKRLLAFSFLLMSLLNSSAQKQKAFFDIGTKQILFTLEEKGGSADDKSKIIYAKFLNDSVCVFKKPAACYKYDTATQINPVTFEEEASITVDSTGTTKFNLGSVTKADLNQAVTSQFGLDKSGFDFKLKTLALSILSSKCDLLNIDYANPADIDAALKKIQALPAGSFVVIAKLDFENSETRSIYGEFENIVVMKIKE